MEPIGRRIERGPRAGRWARAAALALASIASPAAAADDFVVIVHPSVTGTNIRRPDLAAVFLRKAARWGAGGVVAVPVDQSGTAAVRKAFSEAVLGMPPAAAVQYWQKQMFEAKPLRPPAVKGSDAEVITFVANTVGAVGYVSKDAALPPEVRALAIID